MMKADDSPNADRRPELAWRIMPPTGVAWHYTSLSLLVLSLIARRVSDKPLSHVCLSLKLICTGFGSQPTVFQLHSARLFPFVLRQPDSRCN
jgi:hypothetical protein